MSYGIAEGGCGGKGGVLISGQRGNDLPAQFTWLLGAGRDLKACQRREEVFARLLEGVYVSS